MKNELNKIKDFHNACDVDIRTEPGLPAGEVRKLRIALLKEEFEEYLEGEKNNDIVEIADALGDMLVIIFGTSLSYGIPLDKVFNEIHVSNMTKVINGKVIRRMDGKIMKPASYEPPNIEKILFDE